MDDAKITIPLKKLFIHLFRMIIDKTSTIEDAVSKTVCSRAIGFNQCLVSDTSAI